MMYLYKEWMYLYWMWQKKIDPKISLQLFRFSFKRHVEHILIIWRLSESLCLFPRSRRDFSRFFVSTWRFPCLHYSQRWLQVFGYGVRRGAVPQRPDREKEGGRAGSFPCCRRREGGSARGSWPQGNSCTSRFIRAKRGSTCVFESSRVRGLLGTCLCSIFTTRRSCCTETWSRVTWSSEVTSRRWRSVTSEFLCSSTRTWEVNFDWKYSI